MLRCLMCMVLVLLGTACSDPEAPPAPDIVEDAGTEVDAQPSPPRDDDVVPAEPVTPPPEPQDDLSSTEPDPSPDLQQTLARIKALRDEGRFTEARHIAQRRAETGDNAVQGQLDEQIAVLRRLEQQAVPVTEAINLLGGNAIEQRRGRRMLLDGGLAGRILLAQAVRNAAPSIADQAVTLLVILHHTEAYPALVDRFLTLDEDDEDAVQLAESLHAAMEAMAPAVATELLQAQVVRILRQITADPVADPRIRLDQHINSLLSLVPEALFATVLAQVQNMAPEHVVGLLPGLGAGLYQLDDPQQQMQEELRAIMNAAAKALSTSDEDDPRRATLFHAAANLRDEDLLTSLMQETGTFAGSLPNLPPGWVGTDIGAIEKPGTATFEDGRFVIQGCGANIWGERDGLYFVSRKITGDVSLTTRLVSQERVHDWTKSGLMIRRSLRGNAAHAMIVLSPRRHRLAFQYRSEDGGSTSGAETSNDHEPPV